VTTQLERVKEAGLPTHVALIMDGNGRWARARGLPRTAGHQAGAQAAERLIRFVGERLGLRYITLYAFSTENWNRPADEVDYLMDLLQQFIEDKLDEFVERGVRLLVTGDVDGLPARVAATVRDAVRRTAACDRLHVTIALNYGSRQEIARACRRLVMEATESGVDLDDLVIDEMAIGRHLYLPDLPEPDLIVRTSGEMRLSNFFLWQSAYAEFLFPDTLWPDFTPAEFVGAIAEYQRRERRFGGVGEGDE